MNKIVHYIGLDVHKETIAVSIAPQSSTEVRRYGIHVPDQEVQAIRDLVRARTSAMTDQRQARDRLKGFLLRLGFRYTGKSSWNDAHKRYLSGLVMPQGPQQIALDRGSAASNRGQVLHPVSQGTENSRI